MESADFEQETAPGDRDTWVDRLAASRANERDASQGIATYQELDAAERARAQRDAYTVQRDRVYAVHGSQALCMDIYLPPEHNTLNGNTLVVFFHGGCWVAGTKEDAMAQLEPFLDLGMIVANVEYRTAQVGCAPAAIQDGCAALRWLLAQADELRIDPDRVIVAGVSSGAHLALMTGLLGPLPTCTFDDLAELSAAIQSGPRAHSHSHVRAIINWSGVTDVAALLSGPEARAYAAAWLGAGATERRARLVSPLYALRPGGPPVLTIHEINDPEVPISQALRLQDALTTAGVRHQFVGIPGTEHGAYWAPIRPDIRATLHEFLFDHNLVEFRRETDPGRDIVDMILERLEQKGLLSGKGSSWRRAGNQVPLA